MSRILDFHSILNNRVDRIRLPSDIVYIIEYVCPFSREEAQEYIDMGAINGLFVLGRSIGFIGHYMDQKRLKQGN